MPYSLWDLNSSARDSTQSPAVKVQSPNRETTKEFPHSSHFLSVQFSGIKYSHLGMSLPLSFTFSASETETLYLLNTNSLFSPPLNLWQPPFYFFSFSLNLTTPVPHLSEIIKYLSFCDWLISLCPMSSRFMHVVTSVRISFLFKTE